MFKNGAAGSVRKTRNRKVRKVGHATGPGGFGQGGRGREDESHCQGKPPSLLGEKGKGKSPGWAGETRGGEAFIVGG